MEYGTKLAIRAIVKGLRQSGAISEDHIAAIVDALVEADEIAAPSNRTSDRIAIRQLCMDIAADAGVECPIKHAEPPMGWNY